MSGTSSQAEKSNFSLFNSLTEFNHEQVVVCNDNATGLKAIIAVHNTVLGPGLGGTRFWVYNNEQEAMNDALRLSRGMTYKASISGLNLGGAKAVIVADKDTKKTEAFMRKFGRFVENLNGKYITAEDVGTTTKDMEYIAMETDHVVGLPENMGGGGDPSPVTAYGVYMGMKASAKKAFGNDSLAGKLVTVQGVGKVGYYLVELLVKDGAKVFISDINEQNLKHTAALGGEVISPNDVYSKKVDIFAPCAMGAILNSETIPQLNCAIVCGSANNQLKEDVQHGNMLRDRGILYAPDFLVNAGGLINVYSEYTGYVRERAMAQTEHIYDLTLDIFHKSETENLNTQLAATKIAEERIHNVMLVKSTY
ncbi:MAG: Glu/Leu/Phe/Val dehydrogenase [Bacteroidetes bacterium]|nr:Glu/Leu/Phe/Val dehydrogenase [Bacteroidota bacterium]